MTKINHILFKTDLAILLVQTFKANKSKQSLSQLILDALWKKCITGKLRIIYKVVFRFFQRLPFSWTARLCLESRKIRIEHH